MALLASVEQLAARVGEPIESPAEEALAEAMLQYASDQALLYGNSAWTKDTLPGVVRSVVIEAASRGYQHPAGFESERADSVNFEVHEDWLRSAEFSDNQVTIVRRAAQRSGRVRSLQVSRPNFFRAGSDHSGLSNFLGVPHAPEEEVYVVGSRTGFAFNHDGEW